MKRGIKEVKNPPVELTSQQLRWECPESLFSFKCTDEIDENAGIIGQPRAIKSIKTGLEIKHPGFNIFVSGLSGTGRSSTVREILKQLDRRKDIPDDKLYVHNFKDPDQPRLIRLPAGQGREFVKDMETLVNTFQKHLPAIFESDEYKNIMESVSQKYRSQERNLYQEFEKVVQEAGFAVVRIQMGSVTRPDLLPVKDEKPVPFDELEKDVQEGRMTQEDLEKLRKKYSELRIQLEKILALGRKLEMGYQQEARETIKELSKPFVVSPIEDIREKYTLNGMSVYLDEIREFTLNEIEIFFKKDTKEPQMQIPGLTMPANNPFHLYEVNLIVDNSQRKNSPVIIETAPNYKNLFGTIEKVIDRSGNWVSDFMNIKAGTVLRAEGGYLVINLLEAISEPYVWQTLKRTLKYGQLEIENPESFFLLGQSALKPEPIQLDLKVVLIGDKQHYIMLYNYDEEFRKIFKISADFTDRMDRTEKHISDYACFIRRLTSEENIPAFTPSGVAAIVEESIRMADRQTKLSAKFSDVADLIREAGYWAKHQKSKKVIRKHVEKAITEQRYRRGMIEDQIKEYYEEGLIMIDFAGKNIGQINGLAVYDYGEFSFGKPVRITSTVSMGKAGIINIEREAELSGKIHDKGIQILTGFLRHRFAQDKPLAFTASICFEQSYGGIDGDSASSTELYLLLTTLAGIPIRQDIAVTGSVNQHGEIQPIGGANQKAEGFYDFCKSRRLTGKQGVIIPVQNVQDLQLRPDVVDAVKAGKFHIWPVKTIDEGLAVLTGYEPGVKSANGNWPEGTINYLVDEKLRHLTLDIHEFFEASDKKTQDKVTRPSKKRKGPPPSPKQPTRKDKDEGGSD